MHQVQLRRPNDPLAQRDRRLVAGIAVSVLLHGLLLSLQFGVPGLDAGSGGPIQVRLAPTLPTPPPESLPAAAASPTLPAAVLPPAPAAPPATGLRLVDPLPQPVELAQAAKPMPKAGKPARRAPPRRRAAVAPPLIASAQLDAPFAVAPPLPEIEPEASPGTADSQAEEKTVASAAAVTAPDEQAQETIAREEEGKRLAAADEQQRLAMETERLRRLRDEQERLAAAERDAVVLRERAELAQRETQQREAQRRAGQLQEEQRRAEQLLAEQLSQQQRIAEQQQAAQRAQQQRLAEQALEARRRDEAERQRLAQLREREEALARQEAQQAVAERLAAQEAERIAVQEQLRAQERRRAEELAQSQAAEQAARRQLEERAQAERLAQQRADEAGRQDAAERLVAQALPGNGSSAGAAGPGGPAAGSGDGTGQGSNLPGGGAASRARELLRGLSIPNVAPPPSRPFDTMAGSRRVLADGAERDPPLRLYVDSVRQKLERNAVLGGARFALPEVRIDPLVSLSLRSDGSVDQVIIVRSSGRAETDDAVRRFIQLNARYSAFPPNVAARFDVIEIRRVWRFADGLKLLEEIR